MKRVFRKVSSMATGVAASALALVPQIASAALREPQPLYGEGQQTINLNTIATWVENIANFLLYIGAIIAVIFIIWGGITYMAAGGNTEKAEKAKTRIWNGVIGALIVVGVGVILNTLIYLVQRGITAQ